MGSCTGWFDGSWGQCCDIHDAAYAAGMDKVLVDLDLMRCVANTGHPLMGVIMFLGVTLFGWIFYKQTRKYKK